MGDIALLIISLGIILIGAELFTNSIEWLGCKLKLGAGAVGSVLAAVGTALPETMVPIIAIIGGGGSTAEHEVGIGAILGAPFMLATLAMFITGLAALLFRRNNRPLLLDGRVVRRDLSFFLIVYSVAVLASFLPNHGLKMVAALFLVGAYMFYVYQTFRANHDGSTHQDQLPALYLCRVTKRNAHDPSMGQIVIQIVLALVAIILGAHEFVAGVESLAIATGIPVFVLALIITPIATELPEKFNSVIWVRRGKDTLAIGNITGAMVFQSSIIPAIGIVLTSWQLDRLAILSVVLALISALLPYLSVRKKGVVFPAHLLLGGLFYLLFIIGVVAWH